MSDGAKIIIAGIMAYTVFRVAGKCTDATFDPEKGLSMAISKYFFDNAGYFNDVFKKWIPKKGESDEKDQ